MWKDLKIKIDIQLNKSAKSIANWNYPNNLYKD